MFLSSLCTVHDGVELLVCMMSCFVAIFSASFRQFRKVLQVKYVHQAWAFFLIIFGLYIMQLFTYLFLLVYSSDHLIEQKP